VAGIKKLFGPAAKMAACPKCGWRVHFPSCNRRQTGGGIQHVFNGFKQITPPEKTCCFRHGGITDAVYRTTVGWLIKKMCKVRTILYCEDDPVVLMAYRNQLQKAGYHVIPAQDGLEAIKNLSMFVPDLVVLDLMMPKFNGEEVLHFICKNPSLAKVPLVILSSNSVMDVTTEQFLECADKRLLKYNCTPSILLEAIRELLASRREETSANRASPFDNPFSSIIPSAT
jgi:CheY-like chemotaxis protein